MHLLNTTSGVVDGGAEAVDLKQSPADVVILSAADSELASLAAAYDQLGSAAPDLRLANLLQIQHNYSVDLYAEKTLIHAKLIIIRLLGGKAYWPYGIEVIHALAREKNIKLVLLNGGQETDPELAGLSTLAAPAVERLRRYFAFGGALNARAVLLYCSHILGEADDAPMAKTLPRFGLHHDVANPQAAIVFYRSVIEGGQTAPIDALATALERNDIRTSSIFVTSLKHEASARFLKRHFAEHPPSVIINATGFAVGDEMQDPLAPADCR